MQPAGIASLPCSPVLSAVRDRLRWWGSHYRVTLDALMPGPRAVSATARLSYSGSSVLADLIDHRGFVPGPTVRAPRPVDPAAAEVETAVVALHRLSEITATVLRAHYCAAGPVTDKAAVIARAFVVRFRKPAFYRELQAGEFFTAAYLEPRSLRR